jgi:hypothetical protein
VKAGQFERCQLHKIIRRGHPAGLVVERQEVRTAISVKVDLRIETERSGDRWAILGPVVTSRNTLDDPVCIRDKGWRVAFNERVRARSSFCMSRTITRRVCSPE